MCSPASSSAAELVGGKGAPSTPDSTDLSSGAVTEVNSRLFACAVAVGNGLGRKPPRYVKSHGRNRGIMALPSLLAGLALNS